MISCICLLRYVVSTRVAYVLTCAYVHTCTCMCVCVRVCETLYINIRYWYVQIFTIGSKILLSSSLIYICHTQHRWLYIWYIHIL